MTSLDFVTRHTTAVRLRDDTRLLLRPIVPEDKAMLLDGFERLSRASRYRRFMTGMDRLTEDMLRYLTEIDYVDHFAWAAIADDEPGRPGVGVARYIRLRDDRQTAEAAITVVDEYQGRGVGTVLLEALTAMALENEIIRFRSFVLVENQPMIELLRSLGSRFAVDSPGVLRSEIDLPATADAVRESVLFRMLRAAARGEIGVVPGSSSSGPT